MQVQDGEECSRGCSRHTSHPCERCGRTNAIGSAVIYTEGWLQAQIDDAVATISNWPASMKGLKLRGGYDARVAEADIVNR